MSQVFYKVIDPSSELYRKCDDFLKMENDLREAQKNAIRERVPEFKTYYGERGFNRIPKYTGFVFEHVYDIDSKVWTTKMVDGKMLSKPNIRTKAAHASARNSSAPASVYSASMPMAHAPSETLTTTTAMSAAKIGITTYTRTNPTNTNNETSTQILPGRDPHALPQHQLLD